MQDDYAHDGRVVVENINPAYLPPTIANNLAAYTALAQAYKQLNAPFGEAGLASLKYATASIESNAANDTTYRNYVTNTYNWVASRNAVAGQIRTLLNNAEQNLGLRRGTGQGAEDPGQGPDRPDQGLRQR
ncbi:MAG: hypothetical protein WDN04_10140 [Rhodospirillales bacterium]